MARNKKRDGRGNASRGPGRNRGRYDPGSTPFPRNAVSSGTVTEPTGNSRPQRRQRAVLSFEQQCDLAAKMGFAVPSPKAQWVEMIGGKEHTLDGKTRSRWLEVWEEGYAAL